MNPIKRKINIDTYFKCKFLICFYKFVIFYYGDNYFLKIGYGSFYYTGAFPILTLFL